MSDLIKSETTIDNEDKTIEVICGVRDENNLRQGLGCHRWTKENNPNFYQRYTGSYLNNTIHGWGQFYINHNSKYYYYNGNFYNNKLEGYAQVIYSDGTNFEGLFKNHYRFGPGISTNPDLSQDVGLWVNNTLIRLCCVISPDWIPKIAKTSKGKIKLLKYRDLVEVCLHKRNIAREILKGLRADDDVYDRVEELYNNQVRHRRSLFFNSELYDVGFYGEEDCLINVDLDENESLRDTINDDGKLSKKSSHQSKISKPSYFSSSKGSSKITKISEDQSSSKKGSVSLRSDLSEKSSKLSSGKSSGSKSTDVRSSKLTSGSSSKTLDDVEEIVPDEAEPPPKCECTSENKTVQLDVRVQEIEIKLKESEVKQRNLMTAMTTCTRCCKNLGLIWKKSYENEHKDDFFELYRKTMSMTKISAENLTGLILTVKRSAEKEFLQNAMEICLQIESSVRHDSQAIYDEIVKSYQHEAKDNLEEDNGTLLFSDYDSHSRENRSSSELKKKSYEESMSNILEYLKDQDSGSEEQPSLRECVCEKHQIGNIEEVADQFKQSRLEYNFLLEARKVLLDKIRIDRLRIEEKRKRKLVGSTRQVLITHLLAWNNEQLNKDILIHTFLNRKSEENVRFNVRHLMEARRQEFAQPGMYEKQCMNFLIHCQKGQEKEVAFVARKYNINPDVCDCNGNTGIFFAVAKDRINLIPTLVYLGANLDILNDEALTPLSLAYLRAIAVKNDIIDWESAFLPEPIIKDEEKCELQELLPSFTATTLANFKKFGQSNISLTLQMSKEWFKPLVSTDSPIEQKHADAYVFDTKYIKRSSQHTGPKTATLEPKRSDSRLTFDLHKQYPSNESNAHHNKVLSTITTLLLNGVDPNVGEVPFKTVFLSLFTDDCRFLNVLLTHNVGIEVTMTEDNLTPLHVLASLLPTKDNFIMMEMLILSKANPNVKTHVNHWREQKSELVGKLGKSSTEGNSKIVGNGSIKGSIKTNQGSMKNAPSNKSKASSGSYNLDVPDEGKSPLHMLCLREDFTNDTYNYFGKMALLLINNGANLSDLYIGHTPLSLAVFKYNIPMITTLLTLKNINPYQQLDYNMGNVLSIYCLKKYSDFFNLDSCIEVLNCLVSIGVNPLHEVYDSENIISFLEAERGSSQAISESDSKRKVTNKPSPQLSIKNSSQTRLVIYIKELARNNLMKYIYGRMIELMYEFFEVGLEYDELVDCWAIFFTKNDALQILLMLFRLGVLDYDSQFHLNVCAVLLEHIEKINEVKDKKLTKRGRRGSTVSAISRISRISRVSRMSPKKGGSSKKGRPISPVPEESQPVVETSSNMTFPLNTSVREAIQPLSFERINIIDKNPYLVQPEVDRDEIKYKICYQCLKGRNKDLLPCPVCFMIFFCSYECNKENLLLKPPLNKHRCKILFYPKQKDISPKKKEWLGVIQVEVENELDKATQSGKQDIASSSPGGTSVIIESDPKELNKYEALIEKIHGKKFKRVNSKMLGVLEEELQVAKKSKNKKNIERIDDVLKSFKSKKGKDYAKFIKDVGAHLRGNVVKIDLIRNFRKKIISFVNDELNVKTAVKTKAVSAKLPSKEQPVRSSIDIATNTIKRRTTWKVPLKFALRSRSKGSKRRRRSRRKKSRATGKSSATRKRSRRRRRNRSRGRSRSKRSGRTTDNKTGRHSRPRSGLRRDRTDDEDEQHKWLMKLYESGRFDFSKIKGGKCMCSKLPRQCYLIMELITQYFPELDFSKLCLPYACYENGQIYYRFIDSNVFCKNFSHM